MIEMVVNIPFDEVIMMEMFYKDNYTEKQVLGVKVNAGGDNVLGGDELMSQAENNSFTYLLSKQKSKIKSLF